MGVNEAKVVLALAFLNGRPNLNEPLGYNALARAAGVGSNHLSRVVARLDGLVAKNEEGYRLQSDTRSMISISRIMLESDDRLLSRFLASDLHIDWLRHPSYSVRVVANGLARLLCGTSGWTDEAFDSFLPDSPASLRQQIAHRNVRATAERLSYQTESRPPLVKRYVPEREGSMLWLAAFLSPKFYRFARDNRPWPGKVVQREDGAYRIWIHRTETPAPRDPMVGTESPANALLALAAFWVQEDTARFPDSMSALDRLYRGPIELRGIIKSGAIDAAFTVGEGMEIRRGLRNTENK